MALGTALALVSAPVFWQFGHRPETPVAAGTWALVVVSALANVVVIAYHYTIPAHPKFLMLPWRRWVLRAHIVSGTVELVCGLIACFGDSPMAARAMAVAALGFHVPSALVQTGIVFGSRAIMVPSYVLCILTHAFCAGMLLAQPDSRMWAVNTFLVFNVYVWCRVYYYLFDLLNLFSAEKYTIAILAAGATMIPALFGPLGFLLLAGFVGTYIVLYRALFARSPAAYGDFVRERPRDRAIPDETAPRWETDVDEEGRAGEYFELLDRDADGQLNRDELRRALAPWGLSAAATDLFADRLLAAGAVDRAGFETQVWSIGAVRNHGLRVLATERAVSERDQAELVFRHLDVNRDGVLSSHDLDLLLGEWGLPAAETRRYLRRAAPGATEMAFDGFFKGMRPVWRFIYYEVFRADYATSRGDMIRRSVSALVASRKTDLLREKVKRELLAQVSFLQSASDELVADLAASLVTETHDAGACVFAEGSVGQKFYLIAGGVVRVVRAGDTVAELGVGGCMGEGALLTDEPRAASVWAATETVLFSLSRGSFLYLTEKYPTVRADLERLHRERSTANNRLALQRRLIGQVPFLRAADAALLDELASALVPLRRPAGEVIVREGEPGDRLFIIEEGTVRISRQGETLAHLTGGGCFGEGALLSGERRGATARAQSSTRLLALDRDDFERIAAKHPQVRTQLLELHRTRTPFNPAEVS